MTILPPTATVYAYVSRGQRRSWSREATQQDARSGWPLVGEVLEAAGSRGLPPPNVDFALAAMTGAFGLPVGTAETIFAIGRMAGWVAHAAEQYADPVLIRPHGLYVGP